MLGGLGMMFVCLAVLEGLQGESPDISSPVVQNMLLDHGRENTKQQEENKL